MKTQGCVFLISVMAEGECSISCPGRFIQGQRDAVPIEHRGWMCPRTYIWGGGGNLPLPGIEARLSARSLVILLTKQF